VICSFWRCHASLGRAASGGTVTPEPPRATGAGPELQPIFLRSDVSHHIFLRSDIVKVRSQIFCVGEVRSQIRWKKLRKEVSLQSVGTLVRPLWCVAALGPPLAARPKRRFSIEL